jgi:dTDP-4-dehydrorhamnose reductase
MNKHRKIIFISGAGGQLGRSFHRFHEYFSLFNSVFYTRSDLNILDENAILSEIKKHRPSIWINCAAYTQVDKAEEEIELAYRVNAEAVKLLAETCTKNDIQLIHFSSDYVYHLDPKRPLLETDICQPKSQYAKSKFLGEQHILKENSNHVIIRSSWLYAPFGHNFVNTILRLVKSRDELRIVNDQIGAPTNTLNLAADIYRIMTKTEKNPLLRSKWKGIFNYANAGRTNWYEYALEIVKTAMISNIKISPISSDEFNAKAPRPAWSIMSTDKICQTFSLEIENWKTSLHECIHEMIN